MYRLLNFFVLAVTDPSDLTIYQSSLNLKMRIFVNYNINITKEINKRT